jgi:predicted PurR-regulated permease PerM
VENTTVILTAVGLVIATIAVFVPLVVGATAAILRRLRKLEQKVLNGLTDKVQDLETEFSTFEQEVTKKMDQVIVLLEERVPDPR